MNLSSCSTLYRQDFHLHSEQNVEAIFSFCIKCVVLILLLFINYRGHIQWSIYHFAIIYIGSWYTVFHCMESWKDNSGETPVVDAQNIFLSTEPHFIYIAICIPYNQTNHQHSISTINLPLNIFTIDSQIYVEASNAKYWKQLRKAG